MQRDMESKQQLYSRLQRQLDGLQQDLQTKQAQIDQQQRLAAAAKQAEERHGQLYHTYMKRALVNPRLPPTSVFCRQAVTRGTCQICGGAIHCYFKIRCYPVCTSIGKSAHTPVDECAALRHRADACNCYPVWMSLFVHPKWPCSLFIDAETLCHAVLGLRVSPQHASAGFDFTASTLHAPAS